VEGVAVEAGDAGLGSDEQPIVGGGGQAADLPAHVACGPGTDVLDDRSAGRLGGPGERGSEQEGEHAERVAAAGARTAYSRPVSTSSSALAMAAPAAPRTVLCARA
jgi:hypothetical protein